MINLFFSYSHKDEDLRNELDKHLTILKRQGHISTWHDRCIIPGNEFAKDISMNLRNADIVLLLVSADFIASDYCYDIEMKLAMDMHASGQAVVIPVILRPCDWHDAPFGKLTGIPKDGKPVTKFPSYDDAFLEITNELKKVISSHTIKKKDPLPSVFPVSTTSMANQPRSSNLRIKKNFSDHERDTFLDEAFIYISNFFEGSLKELKNRNPEVDFIFKSVDSQTITASVYINGQHKSDCLIASGQSMLSARSIIYSNTISSGRNSFNESLSVADDGYKLLLKPMGMGFSQASDDLTNEGAAEYFWGLFMERLQRN